MARKLARAIEHIEREGILLVYPLDNRSEPKSLWHCFYPRSEMKWEWDDGSDNRVAELWHLRAELSLCRQVVYAKWFRGRATLFSPNAFVACVAALGSASRAGLQGLSQEARSIEAILGMDSPLSTKQLKRAAELQGKQNERALAETASGRVWRVRGWGFSFAGNRLLPAFI